METGLCDWHQNNISRWKPNHAQLIMRYLEQREFYLDYHRQFVFLDDINTVD